NIWHVRPKAKKGWLKMIKDRLLSSSLVIGLGFLLVVSLVVNGAILAFTDRLQQYLPDTTVFLFSAINFLLTFFIIFILFSARDSKSCQMSKYDGERYALAQFSRPFYLP